MERIHEIFLLKNKNKSINPLMTIPLMDNSLNND